LTSEAKLSVFTEYPNPAQDTAAGTKHMATKVATKEPIQTKRIDIHQLNIMKHDDSDDTFKNMQTNWQRG
jgi:hypothetical protein